MTPQKMPITKRVERIISKNPNLEFAMVKAQGQNLKNISKNQTKYSVDHSTKKYDNYIKNKKNKPIYFIHTHPKNPGVRTNRLCIPSLGDILQANISRKQRNCSDTIFVNNDNEIIGKIQFKIKKNHDPLLDKLSNSFTKVLSDSNTNKMSTILNKEIAKYYEQLTKQFIRTHIYLYTQDEFVKLWNNQNKFDVLMYHDLGVIIHYTPNKARGYAFDQETYTFVKENDLKKKRS